MTYRLSLHHSIALPLAFAALAIAGCSSSNSQFADAHVYHASSTAPNVDVSVGQTFVTQNLAFGSESGYTPVVAGTSEPVSVYAAGSDATPVFSASINPAGNSAFSIFALGELSHFTPLIKTEDPVVDAAAPASGDAKVRVVHGSYVAGPVDVYVTAPGTTLTSSIKPTLTDITFPSISGYLQVPAGSYQVQITATGTQSPVLINVPSLTLISGNLYTAIAVDPTAATGSVPSVILYTDPPVPTGYVHP